MSFLRACGLPAYVTFAARPLCRIVDAVAARMPQNPLRMLAPRVSGQELNVEALLPCLSEFSGNQSLRPVYDDYSLQWLLERVAQKKGYGTLQKVVVHNDAQKVLGWYLYFVNPGGISQVLHISAIKNSMHEVLDHLFYHAWWQGVIALSGRLEPRFMQELTDKNCLFTCGGPWCLIHSNSPELLQAIHSGDAWLSRLEGEWWMSF